MTGGIVDDVPSCTHCLTEGEKKTVAETPCKNRPSLEVPDAQPAEEEKVETKKRGHKKREQKRTNEKEEWKKAFVSVVLFLCVLLCMSVGYKNAPSTQRPRRGQEKPFAPSTAELLERSGCKHLENGDVDWNCLYAYIKEHPEVSPSSRTPKTPEIEDDDDRWRTEVFYATVAVVSAVLEFAFMLLWIPIGMCIFTVNVMIWLANLVFGVFRFGIVFAPIYLLWRYLSKKWPSVKSFCSQTLEMIEKSCRAFISDIKSQVKEQKKMKQKVADGIVEKDGLSLKLASRFINEKGQEVLIYTPIISQTPEPADKSTPKVDTKPDSEPATKPSDANPVEKNEAASSASSKQPPSPRCFCLNCIQKNTSE